jgi:hypothetical protein
MITDVLSPLDVPLFSILHDEKHAREILLDIVKKRGKKDLNEPAPVFYEIFADFFNDNKNVGTNDLIDLFLGYYGLGQDTIDVVDRIVSRFQALSSIPKQAGFFISTTKHEIVLVQVENGWIVRIRYGIKLGELQEKLSIEIENDTNTRTVSVCKLLNQPAFNEWVNEGNLTTCTVKFKEQLLRKAGKVERTWALPACTANNGTQDCYGTLVTLLNADPQLKIYRPDEVLMYSELHCIAETSENYPAIELKTENYFKKKKIICHFSLQLVETDLTSERWDRIKELFQLLLPE